MTSEVRKSYDDPFIMVPLDTFYYLASEVSSSAMVVYLALLARANRTQGDSCFPSLATIAKDANVSRRTVSNAIDQLQEAGAITVENRMSASGDATSNLYWVHRPVSKEEKSATGRAKSAPPSANDSLPVGQNLPSNHKPTKSHELTTSRSSKKEDRRPISGGEHPRKRPPLTIHQLWALDPVEDRELVLLGRVPPAPPPGAGLETIMIYQDLEEAWRKRHG